MKEVALICAGLTLASCLFDSGLAQRPRSQKKRPTKTNNAKPAKTPEQLNLEGIVEPMPEWTYITQAKDFRVFINEGKIAYTEGRKLLRVWVKHEYTSEAAQAYSYSKTFDEHDCVGRRVRQLQQVFYNKDGEVHDSRLPVSPSWVYIVPESIDEAIHDHVCRIKVLDDLVDSVMNEKSRRKPK